MKTKAALRREIEDLEDLIGKKTDEVYNQSELPKAEEAFRKAQREYNKDLFKVLNPLKLKINQLHEEIESIGKSKALVVPQDVSEFVREVFRGTTERDRWVIKWFSPDGRYVYASLKGHMSWSGRGETSYYQTQHRMWDRLNTKEKGNGWDAVNEKHLIFEHEGKLPAATLKQWKERAMSGKA